LQLHRYVSGKILYTAGLLQWFGALLADADEGTPYYLAVES
jgi:hypothetical protein